MGNTFYIVRHGQTNWNLEGKTQGHGDSSLTELGRMQAKNLSEKMSKFNIDLIYSSDLGRAVETAQIIGKKLNLDVIKTPLLREMGFGVWEGLVHEKIKENYLDIFTTWRNEPHLAKIPNGETLQIIKDRLDEFFKEINETYDNKHILLVSHSITVKVMLLSFLNSGLENIYRISQDNTALNIVQYRDYGPVILKMNDTSHIDNL
jgi:probable phosphoglycerate mutase